MRQKSGSEKQPAEEAIKDIPRAARRHFRPEEKILFVPGGGTAAKGHCPMSKQLSS